MYFLTRMTYIFDYLSNQISNQVEQKWTILVKMVNGFQSNGAFCRTPTLAKCGREAQHLEKSGVGVLRDSRMFRARQQGAKHLALECSWCHWKGIEA